MVAFGVLGVIAIANGLSTYIFDGQTLEQKVNMFSGAGLVDYAGLAIGLTLGFAILKTPMDQLQAAISKN